MSTNLAAKGIRTYDSRAPRHQGSAILVLFALFDEAQSLTYPCREYHSRMRQTDVLALYPGLKLNDLCHYVAEQMFGPGPRIFRCLERHEYGLELSSIANCGTG